MSLILVDNSNHEANHRDATGLVWRIIDLGVMLSASIKMLSCFITVWTFINLFVFLDFLII